MGRGGRKGLVAALCPRAGSLVAAGSECWLLPLPFACGVAEAPAADAVTDWRFLAAGARPAHHPLSAPAAHVAPSRGSGRYEVLAEELQPLILAHAAADLHTLLAAYAMCARWSRLLRRERRDAAARPDRVR